MGDHGYGYWQTSQNQIYDSGDDINSQLLAETWTVPPPVDDATSLQLDVDLELSMLFTTNSDHYEFMSTPDVDPPLIPIQETLHPLQNESHDSQHQVYPGTVPSSSHELRPEACVFEPWSQYQGQYTEPTMRSDHTANTELINVTHGLGPRSSYGTPIILDAEAVHITDERLAHHMLAMQRAANKHRQQRRRSNASSHRSDQSHHSRIEKPARASSSQTHTVQTRNIPSANFHGWEPGFLAPSEDIASWSHGAYTLSGSQLPADPPVPVLSSGSVSFQGTASIVDSNTSFCCSSEGCQKSFDRKSALDHHERNHRVGRHVCSICAKAFVFYKDLKRHMKIHDPDRHIFCTNIACPYHTKGFQRQDHLKRHMQNVHGDGKQKS